MNKIPLFCLILILTSYLALAQNQLLESQITIAQKELVGKEIPPPLQTLFASEKINIYLTENTTSTITISIQTQEGKISQIQQTQLSDPSLNIFTDLQTVTSILQSNNPQKELKDAYNTGKITYKAIGLKNKIKFSISFFIARLAGSFDSEEQP